MNKSLTRYDFWCRILVIQLFDRFFRIVLSGERNSVNPLFLPRLNRLYNTTRDYKRREWSVLWHTA